MSSAGRRGADRPVRVWDPVVRLFHWSLVACVALAWVTLDRLVDWHQPVGWVALALVAARTAWGFAGPRRARFAQFVRGPAATLRYARRALAGTEPRHVGHNPLGGWMVLALFAWIAALALTGWLYTTDRFWGDETVERMHEALAWSLLGLVAIHVAGVLVASRRHRENLVRSMIDGRKRAPDGDDVA